LDDVICSSTNGTKGTKVCYFTTNHTINHSKHKNMIKQRHYYKRVQNNLYTNADKYSYMENLQMKQNKQINNQP